MTKETRSYWQMREDQMALTPLIDTIQSSGATGIVTSDITRLYGSNQTRRLRIAERIGLVVSVPTNRRHLGRRWYATPYAPTA